LSAGVYSVFDRALDLRKTVLNVGPADLLDDVEFELIGLSNSRNYGLKATGFQAVMNTMAPFIMANAANVDTLAMLSDGVSELIGPEEAARYIKIPTAIEDLRPQTEENEALVNGAEVEVDPEDNDNEHMRDMQPLWQRAQDPRSGMPYTVRRVVTKHWKDHEDQRARKKVQEAALDKRKMAQQAMQPPEAGGQAGATGQKSPMAGGMSNGLEDLATGAPGQSQGENPGPPDPMKSGKAGRSRQTMNQSQNTLGGE